MLDEKTRALLGDKEAQKNLAEQGILIPCQWCNRTPGEDDLFFIYGKYSLYHECKKAGPMRVKGKSRMEVCAKWNTRAPILTEEQIKKLEE